MIKIIDIIDLSQDEYNELLFNHGIDYLKRKFDGYNDIMSMFSRSKLFWIWYKKQYQIIDDLFIIRNIKSLQEYNRAHRSMSTFPSPALAKRIQEDYDEMFQKVKNKELQKV